jgi:hypothetical protein
MLGLRQGRPPVWRTRAGPKRPCRRALVCVCGGGGQRRVGAGRAARPTLPLLGPLVPPPHAPRARRRPPAVFCCLPHATTQEVVCGLPGHVKVVDLSADFRLRDVETYAEWWVVCADLREVVGCALLAP